MRKNWAKRRDHKKSWLESLENRVLLSTIYVDAAAAGGGDGTSWATAFVDLQPALAAANPLDRIQVAGGVYKPTAGADRDASFELKSGVTIAGGYAGAANANPDLRDLAAYPTTLSGEIGAAGIADNSNHVLKAVSIADAELDGLIITAGSATDGVLGGDRVFGGGLYVADSSLTVRDSSVINNQSLGGGGGVYITGNSTAAFIAVSFLGNGTSEDGGAAAIDGAATVSFTGGQFDTNVAGDDAGGIASLNGASISISGVTFRNNRSVVAAGAIQLSGGTLTVRDSSFLANRAATTGGAISDTGSTGTAIANTVFVGNTAPSGAGMYIATPAGTAPSLANVTFNANTASQGGAIYNASPISPTVVNSILWGNAGGEIVNTLPQAATVTYSIVQGPAVYAGTGNHNVNPLLSRTATFGLDGLWGTADDDYGDLTLQIGSPAIDAGNNTGVPGGVTTDLAGASRFINVSTSPDTGAGPAPIVDMGAFETPDVPAVSFAVAAESSAETGAVNVVVQLSEARPYAVTIPFIVSGLAGAGDYALGASSPLTIPAGQTSAVIPLQITADALYELDETVVIFLGQPTNGQLGATTTYTLTVTDDDLPVLDAIGDQVAEAGLPFTFTATAADPAAPGSSLTFSLDAGAPAGASIDPQTGVFTWTPAIGLTPGEYPVTVRVAKTADAGLFDTQVVNITVTDLPVAMFVQSGQTAVETGTVTIVVQLSSARSEPISIPFAISGSAQAGSDYTASASPLVIPANETSASITLQIAADSVYEANEAIIVTLGAPQGAVLGSPAVHTVVIADDDAPTLNAIADQSVQAGQAVSFTATAADPAAPGSSLTFSLDAGAPAGASIDPQTGVFTWTPAADLTPGVYPVTVRVAKIADPNSFDTQAVNITVAAAQQPVLGSITGTLFNDASGEGKRAANEGGLAGRSVFLDRNFNGIFDLGEPQAITDAAGTFTFSGLPVGFYSVRPIAPAGWRASGAGFLSASVVSETPVTAGSLSLTTRQLIRGLVFSDRNGNKKQDAGDKGLAGFRVYVDTNRNGQYDRGEPVAKTTKSGAYTLSTLKLKTGKYLLRLIPSAKFSTVSPKKATFPVTLKSGTTLLNRNFAEKPIA